MNRRDQAHPDTFGLTRREAIGVVLAAVVGYVLLVLWLGVAG